MKIALIGNQNSGKTTLFNLLTGSNQKIGNWPGVTVEKKSGYIKNTEHELIDLPGIYSLSPYTSEEKVSRNFLLEEKPDLVINIIDATSIERSLYLTTQLMELDTKIVVALNMCDLLEKKGLSIDENLLSKQLGVGVVKISALKKKGIDELINTINNGSLTKKTKQIYEPIVEESLEEIIKTLKTDNKRFIAVKVLEQDEDFTDKSLKTNKIEKLIKKVEDNYDSDVEQIIANQRYNFVVKVKEKCVVQKQKPASVTDKLDKVFLNKWLAIPIFVAIMALVYYLSVGVVGTYTVDLVDSGVTWFSDTVNAWLTNLGASDWAISLLCDGMIAGNRVKYLCVDDTHGHAIVEGSSIYDVEFEYCDGKILGLTCSCFCGGNCKHEVAVMLQLREILNLIEGHYQEKYDDTGYFSAIFERVFFNIAIDGKRSGSLILE